MSWLSGCNFSGGTAFSIYNLCVNIQFLSAEVGGAKVLSWNKEKRNQWTFLIHWLINFGPETGCSNNNGNFSCATGDCGSGQVECNGADVITPATLVDIKVASNGGQDLYSVSNTYGFNVPVSVTPRGGNGPCEASSCPANINYMCPPGTSSNRF
ncbi:pathogenesis-related thaumatin family protein [Medicago truncatula]|uniref:Pathogenesis-related thaumatin family protein n=1 Tax=Medicago truncatula TaxID=3880 RepID=A0A072VL35_MEDTR|nr:pathogenesis-related thaumatin family protein [Medicago truncatula]